MAAKWIPTAHKGLRYYEHPTRRHGKKRDRYYAVRFRCDEKLSEYGIGWWSDGIPEETRRNDPDMGFEEYAISRLKLYKANVKAGTGPKSPKENRVIATAKREQAEAEQERLGKEALTFSAFFDDDYLPAAETSRKKPKSISREKGLYSVWIKPAIGHLTLKTITSFNLKGLKLAMEKKKQSPRSVQYALAVVRQVYKYAKEKDEGRYEGDIPMLAKKDRPVIDNGRMRFLTRAEADAILATLKDRSQDVHDMTLLSLHAGLRFSEIASLTWQDVDLKKGTLTIRDAKAGSRYAFLTEQAADMLRIREKGKPSDYVFQKRVEGEGDTKKEKMNRISPTFFRTVSDLKLNEGISDRRLKVCFHSCRHSYASWMIEQGADLYIVQKLLGHKTNVMTQRYAHMGENRLRNATKAFQTAWKKPSNQDQPEKVVNFAK